MVPLPTIAERTWPLGVQRAANAAILSLLLLPLRSIACAGAKRRGKAGELQELNSSHACGSLLTGILQSQDLEKKRRKKKATNNAAAIDSVRVDQKENHDGSGTTQWVKIAIL